ncbi:MAG TPA: HAD-IIA family hydrolase [Firmicutes bacterium]|nr:HAD-IIA family hydrolase [Bacillota bacterium]
MVEKLNKQTFRESLHKIKTFLLDLDGTVYLGDSLFPWAPGFFQRLRELGKDFIFVTNNTSRRGLYWAEKLRGMGISLQAEQVFTSGEATRYYLKQNYPEKQVYLVGTPDLEEEFAADGFKLTTNHPSAVVFSFDQTLTYEKLRVACTLIRQGVPFIATHPDLNCPTPQGPIPDCGAMIAAVTAATNVEPKIIGKPYPEMVEALCQKYNLDRKSVAIIGDRLYTDIAMGQQAGITSILVLSGETKYEDLKDSPYVPNLIATNLGMVTSWLE